MAAQFQVLHTEKCDRSACKGVEIHNQRKITSPDGVFYNSHTNENIDTARKKLNVALVGSLSDNYYQMIKDRITAIRGGIDPSEMVRDADDHVATPKLRKDAVWSCDTIISASPEFFAERFGWNKDDTQKCDFSGMNEFFQKSVDFIGERYGKKNIIGAIIHYDETTPHMHIHWIPVVSNQDAPTREKLSYKALASPMQLRILQTDYNTFLRANGYKLERGEIDSKRTHCKQQKEKLDIELKNLEKKMAALEKVKSEITVIEESHKEASEYSSKEFERVLQGKDRKISDLKYQIKQKDKEIDHINNAQKLTEKKVESLTKFERAALDQDSESRIRNEFIKKNPAALEAMRPCIEKINEMYETGKELIEHKQGYDICLDYRIACQTKFAENGSKIGDAENLIKELELIGKELPELRSVLLLKQEQREALNQGFANKLKIKEKKELDNGIAVLAEKIAQKEKALSETHELRVFQASDITGKIEFYKEAIQKYKNKQNELTVEADQKLREAIEHRNAYIKLAVTTINESEAYQEVISRYDGDYISPDKKRQRDLDINNLTANERNQLRSELPENCPALDFVNEQEPKTPLKRKVTKNIKLDGKLKDIIDAAIEKSQNQSPNNENSKEATLSF